MSIMFKKPSFLERLVGSSREEVPEDSIHDDVQPYAQEASSHWDTDPREHSEAHEDFPQQEGELPIDMYRTGDNIVIRALVAGVEPDDLDIAITRDTVTIRGTRDEHQEAPDEDYQFRELYWGGFSRTIVLPEEIMIDEATAKEKHGLLTIILPKVDKDRSTKLRVKPH